MSAYCWYCGEHVETDQSCEICRRATSRAADPPQGGA